MKKEYKRPTIEIEEFTLAAHIASCGVGANSGNSFGKPLMSETGCGGAWVDAFGDTIFGKGNHACETQYGDGIFQGLCYNTPHPSLKIFCS
ncbi:MAG: hypothetical protein V8R80_04075 [Eubacterium sp.]